MAQKGFFEPSSLFKNCPNLIELDLSHNIIQFNSKLIKDMFTPLKKLKFIWLESMYLAYMPTYFFNRFPLIVIFELRSQIITLKVIFISNIHFCIGNPVSEPHDIASETDQRYVYPFEETEIYLA
jgi:hypothetical protein